MVGVEASRITMRNIYNYIYLPLFLNNETNWIFLLFIKTYKLKLCNSTSTVFLIFLLKKILRLISAINPMFEWNLYVPQTIFWGHYLIYNLKSLLKKPKTTKYLICMLKLRCMKVHNHWYRALDYSSLKVLCILDIKTLKFLFSRSNMSLNIIIDVYSWVVWVMCFSKQRRGKVRCVKKSCTTVCSSLLRECPQTTQNISTWHSV